MVPVTMGSGVEPVALDRITMYSLNGRFAVFDSPILIALLCTLFENDLVLERLGGDQNCGLG